MIKKRINNYLNLQKSFGIEYSDPIMFDNKITSSYNLPSNTKDLEDYIEHCNLCELSKQTKDRLVGYGNIKSEFYIVGVSCDFNNPTIKSILVSLIKNVLNLNIDDIYLTNLIKCPIQFKNSVNNRNINLCKEYFIKQVDIIRPRYIIAMGDVSKYLLENENDNSYVYGNCYEYNNSNLIPMLDLEFVYKNPSYRDELHKDFEKLKILMG
jgi:DNA polymerase